ncbi:MAG: hemolysin III family protein [Acidimicrobiia bacterium]|nr:hemolysin III family protein [Acidimicrobiia bacterium]
MDSARWTLGKMQNPVRGILHGSAAVAAVVGTLFLVIIAPNWGLRIGVIIFGGALVALYTTSSLYHSIPWCDAAKKRMQRLDHSMIIALIAGTYTPIIIATLDGPLRWTALAVAWGAVLVDGLQHLLYPTDRQGFSMALGAGMGWLGIALAGKFVSELGWTAAGLAALGGVIYTIGMFLLITNRPRLWPRVFSYHEVFHVLVVAASIVHFVVVWRYVLPLGAA